MLEKIFFQSSLPRSGSTLLQNIMGQNPDFYVTPTSGLMELLYGAKFNYSSVDEFKFALNKDELDKAFNSFLNEGMHAYCRSLSDKKYFLDKGRGWGYYIFWLEHFMKYQPKIIHMVRDLRDVYTSMEKAFIKSPNKDVLINWGEMKNNTVPKRIDFWASSPPIGISIERLESIISDGHAHKVLFIKYEDFCLNPEQQMARIYNYLEIPYFQHNFDYIPQITHEDDSPHMGFGDHIIRNSLSLTPSRANEILGTGVCDWIYNRYKWFYDYFRYNK
jgi:sulfotransferase